MKVEKNLFFILKEQTPFLIAQSALLQIQKHYSADISSTRKHGIRDSGLCSLFSIDAKVDKKLVVILIEYKPSSPVITGYIYSEDYSTLAGKAR